MLEGQKIVVVMPAYNAARTLRQTYDEVMATGIVDLVILVDDASKDETAAMARTLPQIQVEVHPSNRGYGGNQKTGGRCVKSTGSNKEEGVLCPDLANQSCRWPCFLSWPASLLR